MLLRAVASFCCFYSCGTSSAAAPSTQPQSNYCSHVPISRAIFLSSELPLVLTVVVIPLRYHLIPWIGPEGSSSCSKTIPTSTHWPNSIVCGWPEYIDQGQCVQHILSAQGAGLVSAVVQQLSVYVVRGNGRVGWWWWWWWVRRDHKREIYGSY